MNKQESDILNVILQYHCRNQRALAERCGFSLGMVNRSVKALQGQGFLTTDMELTEKARLEMAKHRPKNAVILAAGYGMRMVPSNIETPKGLLEVEGEPLIERLIRQLHAVKVKEIYVVVGFKKEQYDYLVDRYGVKLVVNMEYAEKNNLHSLAKVLPQLGETYLMPCDLWCRENPFSEYEWYSWYLVSDAKDPDSTVRVSRKWELVPSGGEKEGNHMIGISYLTDSVAQSMARRIETMVQDRRYDHVFWEDALFAENGMPVQAKLVPEGAVVEINTYEQLRELDENSDQLKSDAMAEIERVLSVSGEEITGIEVLKKGMTNRSFLFRCRGGRYIMRIPGEGTSLLINRRQEAAVYRTLDGKGICDESLWEGEPSVYRDYSTTKAHVLELEAYLEAQPKVWTLTHIDAVPDNFLFVEKNGGTEIRLIDWEYAGMQDAHVDLAMFCIYAMYDRPQVDALIDSYFTEGCPQEVRTKIYAYIAVCGLLWSNWCEYKSRLGVEFGEYSLKQYRYAKDYYKLVKQELAKSKGQEE